MDTVYVIGSATGHTLGIGGEWIEAWRPAFDQE